MTFSQIPPERRLYKRGIQVDYVDLSPIVCDIYDPHTGAPQLDCGYVSVVIQLNYCGVLTDVIGLCANHAEELGNLLI